MTPIPDAADWLPHTPGDPMPVPEDTLVQVRFRDGRESAYVEAARQWYWGDDGDTSVTAFRIVRPASTPAPAPAGPNPERGETYCSPFSIRQRVVIDGDAGLVGTVTSVHFHDGGHHVRVAWMHNGNNCTDMFDPFRLRAEKAPTDGR